jgi:3-oxoacyl-[acyl-carrier protein] reductase
MLLDDKTAVIYGAGGAIGGAVARAFAGEGARLLLTGRDVAKVDDTAAFVASDRAGAMTATVVNLSAGDITD